MAVQITTEAEKRVAAVSHRGPYDTISEAFERLHQLTESARLAGTALVGIYYDDPKAKPAAELRSDAGVVVPEGVALPAGLTEVRLPAGRYARTTHIGPYQGLGDAWARLMGAWLQESGERSGNGPRYERYLNTPMNAKPEELKTELYLSLAG
jgi:AraC family transcriptional regulator